MIDRMKFSRDIEYLPVYIFFLVLLILTLNFPFFWDTVQLASLHAHFFFENNFNSIILPNDIDSGHIPTLGIYLAAVWKIAGKSLLVSHLAMWPFVLGIVYQSIILVRRIFSVNCHYYALLILLADATLLAQCTLISPDVLLLFFFLMALNSMIVRKHLIYSLSLFGLALSSMRGMMCVAGLFFAEILICLIHDEPVSYKIKWRNIIVNIWGILKYYLPSAIIASAFLAWHYHKTGWIGYHKDMPWYTLFQPVGLKRAIWNVFILGWRFVDFGRIFVWLAGFVCFLHFMRFRYPMPSILKKLLILTITIGIVLSHSAVLRFGLSGHRYFLPVYILVSLSVSFYLFEVVGSALFKRIMFYLLITGMITGNLWIYPDRIAKGWDSTLAYLPYFPLREKMINYMKDEGIKFKETGTAFPNLGKLEYMDLSGNYDSFAPLDLRSNRFVFYSNIYNNFTVEQMAELKNYWTQNKVLQFMGVKIILYSSPGLENTSVAEPRLR